MPTGWSTPQNDFQKAFTGSQTGFSGFTGNPFNWPTDVMNAYQQYRSKYPTVSENLYGPNPWAMPPNPQGQVPGQVLGQVPGVGGGASGGYQGFTDIMPNRGWMQNLDPGVMAGIREPYEEGAKMLAERFGAAGMGGSARGGMSGNAAAGFGKYYENAAQGIGQQAWNMTSPGLRYPYDAALGLAGGTYPNPVVNQGGGGMLDSLMPLAMMAGGLGFSPFGGK